jgi:hypothetical protein
MDPNTPDQAPGTPTAPTDPVAAPGPPSHSGLRRALTMALIVVLLVAAGLLIYSTATSHPGTVVFSTDLPIAGMHSGCTIDHQVTSVGASTPVYATYMFRPTPSGEEISLSVTKNGRTFVAAIPIPAEYTTGVACFSDTSDLSKTPNWGPGAYHFSAAVGDNLVAAGDLVVT